MEYPKIQTLFKRSDLTHKVMDGFYSMPEFDYLRDCQWEFTEKIDGTNIRVEWAPETGSVTFGGRSDNAQIPVFLLLKLQELFPVSKFLEAELKDPLCLYGEGYGARIQKGGGNYISSGGVDFILFDVYIGGFWLTRVSVEDIAQRLGIKVVPLVGYGNLDDAVKLIRDTKLQSTFGPFLAEGIVAKPIIRLCTARGDRIITKLKHKDF